MNIRFLTSSSVWVVVTDRAGEMILDPDRVCGELAPILEPKKEAPPPEDECGNVLLGLPRHIIC